MPPFAKTPPPCKFGTFGEFIAANPDAIDRIQRLAENNTRWDKTGTQAPALFDYLYDELDRKWAGIKTSWLAYAEPIAKRWAGRHYKRERRAPINGRDPAVLDTSRADTPVASEELIMGREEAKQLWAAVAQLPTEAREVVDAFIKYKSARRAADILGRRHSTYRLQLYAALGEIAALMGESAAGR
jgi:DNA-directed RNA polymerase specialized sigma24 family protein